MCDGFFSNAGPMATRMLESMAILGVESRHVLLEGIDTPESLKVSPTPGRSPFG